MRSAGCVLVCLVLSSCLSDDVCDPGYSEMTGVCYKSSKAGAKNDAATVDDEDASSATADAATPVMHDYTHFGDTCSTDAECKDPAPTCIPPLKYCSRTQCADDESICPPDYACMDISAASPDPSVTHICLKK